MEWKTWLSDKLRELMYPALVMSIVGSVYAMGHTREKEAQVESGLLAAPLPHWSRITQAADDDSTAPARPSSASASAAD
jgi:hypothetical protein